MSSGADLARSALAAAKLAARNKPAGKSKPKRLTAVQRGAGRDPVGLGAALQAIAAAQGWDVQQRAGSLADRWAELAPPELVELVRPEHYDGDTRTLHLRPATGAAASRLRLTSRQLVEHLNRGLGRDVIATVRVLPVRGGESFTAVKPAAAADRFSAENRPAPSPGRPAGDCPAIARPASAPPSEAMQAWRTQYREQRAQAAAEADRPTSPWFDGAYGILREPEPAFLDAVAAQPLGAAGPVDQAARSAASHARALAAARTARRTGDPAPLRRIIGAA